MQVYMESNNGNPILVAKPSGSLKFAGVEMFREPNTVIILLWSNKHGYDVFQISADISPAVRCYNVTQAVNPGDCGHTHFYNKIQEHGSYLLTPGRDNKSNAIKYFRISLTEVEVNIVKSLDTTHRTCYRVLKYILANHCFKLSYTDLPYGGFSSYILKSAVLHHVADGKCQSSDVHTCVESVVNSLLNCLISDKHHVPVMSSVFIEGHNLFQELTYYPQVKARTMQLIMNVQNLMTFLVFTQKLSKVLKEEFDYTRTIQMLENGILDLGKAYRNAKRIADKFLDVDGNWDATGVSVNELFRQLGVPYTLLQEEQSLDDRPC